MTYYDLSHRKEEIGSMCTCQLRKIIAVLIVGLFFMQLIPAKSVLAASDQSAYYKEIGEKIEDMANKYNIPPVLLKAVAWMESGWKQYKLDDSGQPLTDQPLIGRDGIGIGIMQISSYDPKDQVTIDKLKNDINYNLEVGCQMLNQKWRANPKIGNGDRNVLENWYFAVWGYNSWAVRNNPNNLTGKSAYQDSIFSLMGQKYNSAITFAPTATKISKSLLPLMDPPALSSRWSTPATVHMGDLLIDPAQLLSSGGGSGTNAANGDYWCKFYIESKPRGDYYLHALSFYNTAYNSPSITDKSTVSQKILSTYDQLLDEADTLIQNKTDSSDACAAKYYWSILQGPSLDDGIAEQAKIGLQSALSNLLAKADKLVGDGTGASNLSAAQDYSIVLQGSSQDNSISERAKNGLLNAYGTLLTEADKLVLEGTVSSKTNAAKYYSTVLQGMSLDTSLTERATNGLKQISNSTPDPGSTPDPSSGSTPGTNPDTSPDSNPGTTPNTNPDTTPDPSPQSGVAEITRLAGTRAEDTAIKISQAGWENAASPVVLLARVDRFQDALAAAPLAKKYKAPLLLTAPDQLDDVVLQEMKRLGGKKIYVIGGEGAIKKTVTDALDEANMSVERIYGDTAADTAVAIARQIGPSTQVILASSTSFPDALSVSAPAAALGIPILLTEQRTLPDSTKQLLKDFQVTKTFIVGGKFAISAAFDSKGGVLENYGPERLAGDTKYDTMLQIVKYFDQSPKSIVIATGENFPDGLSGGSFAALNGSPMLLIPKQALNSDTQAYLSNLIGKTTNAYILGGTGVISSSLEKSIGEILKQ